MSTEVIGCTLNVNFNDPVLLTDPYFEFVLTPNYFFRCANSKDSEGPDVWTRLINWDFYKVKKQ